MHDDPHPQRRPAPTGGPPAEAAGEAVLASLLDRGAELLGDLGQPFAPAAARLRALRERLAGERFHLAVLGQFKRGKSSFLNALLGEPLLPTAVVPLTAIPTFLRRGASRRVRVHYEDGRPAEELASDRTEELAGFLARFVTEAANPRNALGVSSVEVEHPAPILSRGVVLIDTPGIGSTLRHNTDATLRFLPQCDAALFVVSADPPVTEVELAFLEEVRSRVARVFFVLNKMDYLTPEERRAAVEFFRDVLRERFPNGGEVTVFPISARQGLRARQEGDPDGWRESGLAEVERHLVSFLATEKGTALREALARKAQDLVADALMQLRLAIRSLQMPVEEVEERLRVFEEKIREAEGQQVTAGDLLRGDRNRLVAALEEAAERLRREARAHLEGIVRERLDRSGGAVPDEGAVREALSEAIPRFFGQALHDLARDCERRVVEVLRPHQERADGLIETVRRAAAEVFDIPYHPVEVPDALEVRQRPYWVARRWSASFNEVHAGLVERLLPAGIRRSRSARRLMAEVETLVLHNVENLRWAILQNLDQTLHRFENGLQERLREVVAATRGAVEAALTRRRERSAAARAEVSRLAPAVAELEAIRQGLGALHAGPGARG